jgi:phage terminase small subunit
VIVVGDIAIKSSAKTKRQCFVEEYIIDLNATQAAIRAGYSPKTANEQGSRLLANASVRAAIDASKARRRIQTEVTQDWVVKNLVEVVNRSMEAVPVRNKKGELVTIHTKDGEIKAVYDYDSKGANAALKTLAEHLGMSNKNINLDVKGTIALGDLIDDGDSDSSDGGGLTD